MKDLKCFSLMLIVFLFIIGCSGNHGEFINQTRDQSKVTKQELIDNWSDYDIWLRYHTAYEPPRLIVIIFDTKNDDVKILAAGNYSKVNDQKMWTEIVKENTASDGEFTLAWKSWGPYYTTGVQEVWGPDNQLYGYIVYQEFAVSFERVELVDENTIRLSRGIPITLAGSR